MTRVHVMLLANQGLYDVTDKMIFFIFKKQFTNDAKPLLMRMKGPASVSGLTNSVEGCGCRLTGQ